MSQLKGEPRNETIRIGSCASVRAFGHGSGRRSTLYRSAKPRHHPYAERRADSGLRDNDPQSSVLVLPVVSFRRTRTAFWR